MNSKDIKNLSDQYYSIIEESSDQVEMTKDGYKIEFHTEYQHDNTIVYVFITPPNEEKPQMIQGDTEDEINAAIDYHRQNGEFPN